MPTRYLKPGIRDSELIDGISFAAECLFYRLLVTVDDFGRYDGRPAMVKAACFPIKESMSIDNVDELLRELSDNGLLLAYIVDSKPLIQINKWDNKPRASESKYPPYADTCIHLYTDVCIPRTCVPLTETVTVTETETSSCPKLPKSPKPKKEKSFSPEDELTAEFIWQAVDSIAPNQKKPDLEKWAETIRIMRERDKRTIDEIRSVFLWAHNNSFWRTNIRSPEKLRKQFDNLNVKRAHEINQASNGKRSSSAGIDHTDTSW